MFTSSIPMSKYHRKNITSDCKYLPHGIDGRLGSIMGNVHGPHGKRRAVDGKLNFNLGWPNNR
jgi:hypothetical protein